MKIALATTIVVSSLTFICSHEHGGSTHHRRLAKGSKADMSMSMPDSPRSPDIAKGRKLHLTDTHHRLAKGEKDMSMSMPDSPRSPDAKAEKMSMPSDAKGRKLRA